MSTNDENMPPALPLASPAPALAPAFALAIRFEPPVSTDERTAADALLALARDWQSNITLGSSVSDPAPPMSLSEIERERSPDTDTDIDMADADTQKACDFCSMVLGPGVSRTFRCSGCKADMLCESCCYDMHTCHPEHILQVSATTNCNRCQK